jgi:hypothetical protein
MNEFDLKINEYLQELPEKTRSVILSSRWQSTANQIAKKYSLTNEQTEILIQQIWIFLIGGGDIENMTNELKDELGLSQLLAGEIYTEIEERIFKTIINKLNETEEKKEATKETVFEVENPSDIPPDNLPTGEIDLDDEDFDIKEEGEQKNQPEDTGTNENTKNQIHNSITEFKVETPQEIQTEPVPQIPTPPKQETKSIDFNSKFDTVVKQTDTENRPTKSYVSDPYREPIE